MCSTRGPEASTAEPITLIAWRPASRAGIAGGASLARFELVVSGGRHELLVVTSESDVDRQVGEQLGHL